MLKAIPAHLYCSGQSVVCRQYSVVSRRAADGRVADQSRVSLCSVLHGHVIASLKHLLCPAPNRRGILSDAFV